MGIVIGLFLPWETGVQATWTGTWSLGMEKNVKNQKWDVI